MAHTKFIEEFRVLIEEFVLIGSDKIVGFHELLKLLTLGGESSMRL